MRSPGGVRTGGRELGVTTMTVGAFAQALRPGAVRRAGRWTAVGATEGRAGVDRGRARPADPVVAAGEDLRGVGAAVEDRAGLRPRAVEHRRGCPVTGDPGDGDPWRGRFVAHRLDGLVDELRLNRPASILLDQVEDVLVATLEQTPPNATHWLRASMAERTGLSKSTIGWIWRRFELKPHVQDFFKSLYRNISRRSPTRILDAGDW